MLESVTIHLFDVFYSADVTHSSGRTLAIWGRISSVSIFWEKEIPAKALEPDEISLGYWSVKRLQTRVETIDA